MLGRKPADSNHSATQRRNVRPEDIPALVRRRVLDTRDTNPKLVARFTRIVPGHREGW